MIQFLKKNQKYFKLIFVIAVAFIALTQITGLLKQVQPDKISLIFERLSLFDFVLVIFTGLISVVPMLNYDRVLNQLVGTDYPLPKLIRMSWLINMLNNIAGFGGAVSVGLRSHYYGKNVKEKLLANISKVFFFALSGLSIYGLIGFILVQSGQVDQFLSQYTIWLIGAAVYFVLVLLFTRKNLGGLKKRFQAELLLTSFLEWSGVMLTFIVIGHVLDVKISVASLIVLITASSVIGILSMIPGALGSFDVMMMLGLLHLGVPREIVLVWLLLYRLLHPTPVQTTGMFWLAIVAVIANGYGAYLMTRGQSRNESILNLHMLEDVLGWIAVLILSIVMHFQPWYWLDPLLSLSISIFILTKAIPKFIGTLRILMEAAPETVNYAALVAELENAPEIDQATELCIWSIDGEKHAAMLHMTITISDQAQAKTAARAILEKHNVAYSAIEVDGDMLEHQAHQENELKV